MARPFWRLLVRLCGIAGLALGCAPGASQLLPIAADSASSANAPEEAASTSEEPSSDEEPTADNPCPGFSCCMVRNDDTDQTTFDNCGDDSPTLEVSAPVEESTSCGDGFCGWMETARNCPQDCGPTRGNGICDLDLNETPLNDPAECAGPYQSLILQYLTQSPGASSVAECGDGLCDQSAGENALTCPKDCLPHCGDGVCEWAANQPIDMDTLLGKETFLTCPRDCGTVGDGVCHQSLATCDLAYWGKPGPLTESACTSPDCLNAGNTDTLMSLTVSTSSPNAAPSCPIEDPQTRAKWNYLALPDECYKNKDIKGAFCEPPCSDKCQAGAVQFVLSRAVYEVSDTFGLGQHVGDMLEETQFTIDPRFWVDPNLKKNTSALNRDNSKAAPWCLRDKWNRFTADKSTPPCPFDFPDKGLRVPWGLKTKTDPENPTVPINEMAFCGKKTIKKSNFGNHGRFFHEVPSETFGRVNVHVIQAAPVKQFNDESVPLEKQISQCISDPDGPCDNIGNCSYALPRDAVAGAKPSEAKLLMLTYPFRSCGWDTVDTLQNFWRPNKGFPLTKDEQTLLSTDPAKIWFLPLRERMLSSLHGHNSKHRRQTPAAAIPMLQPRKRKADR